MVSNINKSIAQFERWLKAIPSRMWDQLWFIPIVKNDKIPDVPKGESWLDPKYKLTIQQVAERLSQGKNVAFVATPHTLVVVDLDLYETPDELEDELISLFPQTLSVRTPSGGIHRYYIPLGEIRNADGKGKFKNCGEIRANRKYVLIPGSIVKGKMYEVVETQLVGLSPNQIPQEFLPSVDEVELEKELERTQFEQFKNKYGWSLSDIVTHDFKLWVLLSFLHPAGYPSISEADMATITKLRFWEFDEKSIYEIIRTFRKRDKVIKRDDYLIRTFKKAVPQQLISDFVDIKTWNPKFNTISEGIVEHATKLADPEFSIEMLPDNSFLREYIKSMIEFTDAYPEYHLCSAFSLLSLAVDKQIQLMVKPKALYTNTWFLMIGDSTISRKTTSLSLARDVLYWAGLEDKLIAEEFSVEALIDDLSTKPHALFMRDEIGGFISNFKKVYGLGLDTLFCALYSNPPTYTRKLRRQTIRIEDPYLNILGAGTMKNIMSYLNESDIDTGFLPRFLIVMPERYKQRKRIDKLDPNLENVKVELGRWLGKLNAKLKALAEWNNSKTQVVFTDEALDIFNEYAEEKEKEIFDMQDVDRARWSAIIGRLNENILKLAGLLRFSKFDIIDELDKKPASIEVGKEYMDATITLVDKIFSAYGYKFMLNVESNVETNVIEKVASIIQKEGEIDRSALLKRSKLKARELDEALTTLNERKDILVRSIVKDGRQKTMVYWIGGR